MYASQLYDLSLKLFAGIPSNKGLIKRSFKVLPYVSNASLAVIPYTESV